LNPRCLEAAELLPVHRVGLVLGAGKMAHDEAQLDPFEPPWALGERVELGPAQAEPRHAAVDLERRG
jgi:hypothetical protein